MKIITKFLLVGAVAVTAIAISAAPSEAAKRKKVATLCSPATLCTAPGSGGVGHVMICGGDGKWYQALFTPWCVAGTICPATCS